MLYIESILKIKNDFNSFDLAATKKALAKIDATIVDLIDHDYWVNDDDTLILKLNSTAPSLIVDSMIRLHNLWPDELHAECDGDQIFLRLWWD